uniref:Uncharacterized protein n=1 Tax=Trypanosoma vivax (strain Y486) TaxID=1055687 RepID=G0TY18_TRYVY|nr:conserved hypothetical protein [Trypanosoma vivax Y486]
MMGKWKLFEASDMALVTPVALTWYHSLVLRPGGSQAPALNTDRQDCGGQEAGGHQRGGVQHHRHSGANEVVRVLPCACGRATLDARRLLLPVGGGVERNAGPQIRGAQWSKRTVKNGVCLCVCVRERENETRKVRKMR